MNTHTAIVGALTAVLAGCGNSSEMVTVPSSVPRSLEVPGAFPAQFKGCVVSFTTAAGEIKAHVSPEAMLVHLHTGVCSASVGPLLATGVGSLSFAAPTGTYYIDLENPTSDRVAYSLRVDYLAFQ